MYSFPIPMCKSALLQASCSASLRVVPEPSANLFPSTWTPTMNKELAPPLSNCITNSGLPNERRLQCFASRSLWLESMRSS
ncbi:hypothetical protein MT325_m673R [Paramecium bursaria chlorella virus MT325]|nr:hypothetical protein MT325_m673R [Paramecium bursaria chlorella virus MT325]